MAQALDAGLRKHVVTAGGSVDEYTEVASGSPTPLFPDEPGPSRRRFVG